MTSGDRNALERTVVITNPHGLHARPASLFVETANRFSSKVTIEHDGSVVDGKSVLSLLTLGLNKGSEIVLRVEGEDAEEAMKSLYDVLTKDL